MSIDHGKLLALADRVSMLRVEEGCISDIEERDAIERELRALAQPAEAVEGALSDEAKRMLALESDPAFRAQYDDAEQNADGELAKATEDHRLYGCGFIVDGKRVPPESVQVVGANLDAAQGAVAWRFFVGHSNSWLYEGWTGWTTDAAFRELCERQGFRAEFAYPATNPQAAPAQGAVAFVPVHPKHGPLWGDTYPAGDVADGRSPHYERMPLFTHPQAAPAQGDGMVFVGWQLAASPSPEVDS